MLSRLAIVIIRLLNVISSIVIIIITLYTNKYKMIELYNFIFDLQFIKFIHSTDIFTYSYIYNGNKRLRDDIQYPLLLFLNFMHDCSINGNLLSALLLKIICFSANTNQQRWL